MVHMLGGLAHARPIMPMHQLNLAVHITSLIGAAEFRVFQKKMKNM